MPPTQKTGGTHDTRHTIEASTRNSRSHPNGGGEAQSHHATSFDSLRMCHSLYV